MSGPQKITPTNPGFFQDLLIKAKLIYRLMGDKRVNAGLKLLPVGSLLYLVFPADFLPFMPFDDLAVVGLGMYLFIELCPQYVVEEHMTNLKLNIPNPFQKGSNNEVIVDGEVKEVETKE